MEPVIPEGTTVAININDKKIVDGKIYAISQDGWNRLKILYRVGPNRLSIRSFNHVEHPDEEADLDSVQIIGRMFWTSTIW
jgi:phage repressor protein C with HTH and peptisase S24 domain